MTLREYIEDNIDDVVAELCQYQQCDNCSIGSLFKRCPLLDYPIPEAIDIDMSCERQETDMELKPLKNPEEIEAWGNAFQRYDYLGYNRMYWRNGWDSRWFEKSGDTALDGHSCEGLTAEETDILNRMREELETRWPKGCGWKMKNDLEKAGARVAEDRYLLEAEVGKDNICLLDFDTAFGNKDYPVRIRLYRKER